MCIYYIRYIFIVTAEECRKILAGFYIVCFLLYFILFLVCKSYNTCTTIHCNMTALLKINCRVNGMLHILSGCAICFMLSTLSEYMLQTKMFSQNICAGLPF